VSLSALEKVLLMKAGVCLELGTLANRDLYRGATIALQSSDRQKRHASLSSLDDVELHAAADGAAA